MAIAGIIPQIRNPSAVRTRYVAPGKSAEQTNVHFFPILIAPRII